MAHQIKATAKGQETQRKTKRKMREEKKKCRRRTEVKQKFNFCFDIYIDFSNMFHFLRQQI